VLIVYSFFYKKIIIEKAGEFTLGLLPAQA